MSEIDKGLPDQEPEYYSVFRLRSWQTWPAVSFAHSCHLLGSSRGQIGLAIRSYNIDENPDAIQRSPAICRIAEMKSGLRLHGNRMVGRVEQEVRWDLDSAVGQAQPGEVDIVCLLFTGGTLAEEDAERICSLLSYSAAASCILTLGDLFEPVSPVCFFSGGGFRLPRLGIELRRWQPHTAGTIEIALAAALDPLVSGRVAGSRSNVVLAAFRRFLRAENAFNEEDQYFDYWLVCELLTQHVSAKGIGGKHGKIAYRLARHVGRKKAFVEKAFGLKTLLDHRHHIAHQGDAAIGTDLALIRQIASELVTAELGLDYSHNNLLEERLAAFEGDHK